jgi:ParB family chromosome partitioning protein
VIATIDHQGRIDVRRGLMRPEDRKTYVQSLKKAGQPVPASLQGADAAKGERAVHSGRLMLDLIAHRTAALQAALTANTHVAFALVVQRLVEPIFGQPKYRKVSGLLKVSATLTRHTPL